MRELREEETVCPDTEPNEGRQTNSLRSTMGLDQAWGQVGAQRDIQSLGVKVASVRGTIFVVMCDGKETRVVESRKP